MSLALNASAITRSPVRFRNGDGARLRHARILRVGRAAGLHHLHERLGDELRAADAFDEHRAGELLADWRHARGVDVRRDLLRARDEIGSRRQIGDRAARRSLNVCRTGMPSPACASPYIVSDAI